MSLRVLALIGLCAFPSSAASPNILLITIDTLRADHLGAYGYAKATTPNLDALARQGVRFARAYTPVPITLPAHAALMTGLLPPANRMRDFSGNRLPEGLPTLAEQLRARGYRTGAVVASAVLDSRFGLNRGFDFYYDHFDFNRLLETNLDLMERKGSVVVDEALKWLDANRTQPFFLWVHLYEPHFPYEPPEPFRSRHAGRPYDGEIAYDDAQVGRLLAYLKQNQLEARTSVIVASDHGEGLGQHNEKTHGFFIYDSTLHVPLIMKLVGIRNPQSAIRNPVSLIDVMPTILRHLGLPVPAGVQGRSLLSVMEGKPQGESPLYAETVLPRLHFGWSELRSLRRGRYKYIEAPRPELYDLTADSGEIKNLAAQQTALTNSLRSELGKFLGSVPAAAQAKSTLPDDPALVERLKSLGYVAVSAGTTTESSAGLADPKERVELYDLISEAMSASQKGAIRQSVEMLERAAKVEPHSVTIHYLQGINFYRLRDFAHSVEEFKQVLAMHPDYQLAAYYLALAYSQKGDYEAAQVGFERTLQMDPSNFSAAYNLGATLLAQRKLVDAQHAFERALRLNPEYVQAYNALGETQLALGATDDAIASFRKALELDPNHTRARQNLRHAQEKKGGQP